MSLLTLPASAPAPDSVPLRYGAVIYPGFQALDLFGPLDALNSLALAYPLELYMIAETMEPVSSKPPALYTNPNSNFAQTLVPTHTFDNAPPIDVLIVPGGIGIRDEKIAEPVIRYIASVYPTVKYLMTVCTGSVLAARAGILDGKRATTNKRAWERSIKQGPKVNWVAHARWVVDGNIWTSSGVSAGLDLIFAFMDQVFGGDTSDMIANFLEYERHRDPSWDPYAELYGL